MEEILLTRIAYDNISLEEIQNSEIDEFNKIVLTIAYYEKYNKKAGVSYIKNLKKHETDAKKIKVLNKLFERVSTKKMILFDTIVYSQIIGYDIDASLKHDILKRKKEEQIKEKEERDNYVLNQSVQKQEKKVEQAINSIENTIIQKSIPLEKKVERTAKKVNVVQKPIKNVQKVKSINTNLLIKDVFSHEVAEICKVIYVQMNNVYQSKDAVKAWDNFELLIEKPISDKEALKRMIKIINKLSDTLDLRVDKKRYEKYL